MAALDASTCESATRRLAHRRTMWSLSAPTSSASAATASLEGVAMDTVPPRWARDGAAATAVEDLAPGSHLRHRASGRTMPREPNSPGVHAETRPDDLLLAQLYRGELSRSDRWRMRLDTTSNWALTTTAGVISYAFSNASTSHVVLLLGISLVLTFLALEARRYRY